MASAGVGDRGVVALGKCARIGVVVIHEVASL